ncbi:hypothetical protein BJ912DRAFT_1024588 [Pholiota molesta]|nr:hypothetical protein BJ912DRAFT_1024588 [Pholiota molesta]
MRLNLKTLSLFPLLCRLAYIQRDTTVAVNSTAASEQYDYIVVGSGPGGGPLAARLAQAGYSVLLIDAGEDHGDDVVVQVPVFQGAASEYTPISWQFFVNHYDDLTTAQRDSKFTYRMPDGRSGEPLGIWYPRTGTLAMILIYPAESDWNNIATLTGDSSWSATNMRRYWTKLENNQYLTPSPANSVGHGFNGWLDSSVSDPGPLFKDPTVATSKMLNFKDLATNPTASNLAQFASLDLNSDSQSRDTTSGIYQVPLSINNGTKTRANHRDLILSTANTYKLKLQLNTLVTKIIFDNSTTGRHLYRADPNAASGVVTGSGSFFAKREVIVSGGVYNTPQLLKLSGSPAVGTNMQDRYEVGVIASTSTDFTVWNDCTFLNTTDDACFAKWENDATDHGIYGGNTFAFALTQSSSVADPSADDLITGGIPAIFKGYYPGWSNRTALDAHHWTWLTLKAHARNNAGTVTLTSSDPRDVPQIDFKYWTTGGQQDLQAVYEGVQFTRKMLQAAEPIVGAITEEWPGPNVQTEAEVKQWIQDEAWGHHASCTVPIGPTNDSHSVLDSNFRVKGVNGLRVVDASVFPKIPSFYIVSAVYMISEKAAEVIIRDAQGH